jgi:hypothetical protein
MSMPESYAYRGARAMVILHERHMRRFLDTWKKAKASGAGLPQTEDPNYVSYDMLLRHVLRASRGYMTWMCEKLGLPDSGIRPTPGEDVIEAEAEEYLEHLLTQWKTPLSKVPEERFFKPLYTARWKVDYCLDAMLEHAVMHPILHRFQLKELMEANEIR